QCRRVEPSSLTPPRLLAGDPVLVAAEAMVVPRRQPVQIVAVGEVGHRLTGGGIHGVDPPPPVRIPRVHRLAAPPPSRGNPALTAPANGTPKPIESTATTCDHCGYFLHALELNLQPSPCANRGWHPGAGQLLVTRLAWPQCRARSLPREGCPQSSPRED